MKPYFNDAIVGNSRMLGCLSKNGELIRLFWPNIDFIQHIDRFFVGILIPAISRDTYWLHSESWIHSQKYIDDSNVLITVSENTGLGFRIKQTDFVLPGEDVLVRNYVIENIGEEINSIDFVLYSSMISSHTMLRSTVFDFNSDTLVHYTHDTYLAISADIEIDGFQIGNAYEPVLKGQLLGYDEIGMSGDAGLLWHLGEIYPGQSKTITLYLYAAPSLKSGLIGVQSIKKVPFNGLLDATLGYWKAFLNRAKELKLDPKLNNLYKRTLLTFGLMCSPYGGILAAPEIDEGFTRCGRYGYCWGRDAGFVTTAFDKCGLSELSSRFYEWCFLTQAEDGSWYQRYQLDGNLAPSWGLQIDETGTILWGVWQHYQTIKKLDFLESAWEHIRKAAEFLISFIDRETGLPKPSYDIWEERIGEHTYSAAAVYAGLLAASKIAEVLGKSNPYGYKWLEEANNIKSAIEKNLWDDNLGRFLRSIKVKVNSWESYNNVGDLIEIKVNKKGYKRYVVSRDHFIDASLIGISVPFEVYPPEHEFVTKTVEAIETNLKSPLVGGIKRYENDSYIGGNPWIITTLWLALYYIKIKNFEKAKEYFNWAVTHHTQHGFFPEQVDKLTGEPAWVIPLTWSHAMFIIVLFELLEHGQL